MQRLPWPPLSPLPVDNYPLTAPDSPRKRRRQPRESEDTDGEMTIEAYLYKSDPFRSTTVPDPWPYPVHDEQAPDQLRNAILRHHDQLRDIVISHWFPPTFETSVVLITKPGYPDGLRPLQLVRIAFHGGVRGSFGHLKDAIANLLNRKYSFRVHVEIVNVVAVFQPSIFPIKPNDPAVRVYNAIEGELLDMLNATWAKNGTFFRCSWLEDILTSHLRRLS